VCVFSYIHSLQISQLFQEIQVSVYFSLHSGALKNQARLTPCLWLRCCLSEQRNSISCYEMRNFAAVKLRITTVNQDMKFRVYCTITTKCSRYVTRYTYCSLGNMFTTWSYTLLNRKMFTSSQSSLAGQSDRWPTLLLGLCVSPMSAHLLRELLCLPLSTRSWTRRLSLFPKGHSFQTVCRLIRRFLEG